MLFCVRRRGIETDCRSCKVRLRLSKLGSRLFGRRTRGSLCSAWWRLLFGHSRTWRVEWKGWVEKVVGVFLESGRHRVRRRVRRVRRFWLYLVIEREFEF